MPYIDTHDGQAFYFRDLGPKNSQQSPVILLHGFGMNSLHWMPFVLPLARKQRFILPDFRGFGHSHHLDHDRECVISNYADDLHALIENLNLKSFKLGGISMGAFVALQYQGDYGDHNVEHYLHIDQSPKCTNCDAWHWGLFGQENATRFAHARSVIKRLKPYSDQKVPYKHVPLVLRKELWNSLADFFCDALSRPSHKFIARALCANEVTARQLLPLDNWSAYLHCLNAYLEQDYDMRAIIEKLHTPLTLLVGLKSTMYPSGGQLRIADQHNNCQVVTFPNSGHTPLIDQPLSFYKTLKAFSLS